MKKSIVTFLVLIAILGIQSCSEDFQVTAPYKPVTFVYGLLDISDTAHYIRIQKAFLDESKSAIDMAKNADSNFYKDGEISVVVNEKSGSAIINSYNLQRVDMTLEGYPKDTGIFFTSPNYAYKFKAPLNPNNTYQLVITNHLNNTTNSSEINILDTTKFKMVAVESTITVYSFNFAQTTPPTTIAANFALVFSPGAAKYVEGMIRFHWIDSNITTHSSVRDSADYTFASKAIDGTGSSNLSIHNSSFYEFLYSAMKPAPSGVQRYMDSTDFFLSGGGTDYYNYLVTTLLQSGGLTAGQIKPTYTNISGKDVYGLFSSRAVKIKRNVPIDDVTIDSLLTNPVTAPLNIRGRTGN